LHRTFNPYQYRSVSNGAVRPEEHEVVWIPRRADAKISLGFVHPIVREITAVGSDQREARLESGIESGL